MLGQWAPNATSEALAVAMPQSMVIPAEWMLEAGVQGFKPTRRSFRCDDPHECIALSDIEIPLRYSGYPLDRNGFRHDRMVSILAGIRDNVSLPAIYVERADPGQRLYRVREGVHRYHASLTLGFSHVPAEIIERID
jgi:hypothetical protein